MTTAAEMIEASMPELRTWIGMRVDRLPAPQLGEHTRAVLVAAGYSSAQIEGMIASGAAREAG